MNKSVKIFWLLISLLLVIIAASLLLVEKLNTELNKQPEIWHKESEHSAENIIAKAVNMLAKKDFNNALLLLENASNRYPDNTDIRMLLGEVYYRLKNFSYAEQIFRREIQRNPSWAAGYNNLAETLIAQKKITDAAEYMDQAVRLAPDNGEILLNAAAFYASCNKDLIAIDLLRKAMAKGISNKDILQHSEIVQMLERNDSIPITQDGTD